LVENASTGAVIERIDYDEFGNVLSDAAPGTQPFGFAGGIADHSTGLTRLGARDYDPVTRSLESPQFSSAYCVRCVE
jgi:hypothetical protein